MKHGVDPHLGGGADAVGTHHGRADPADRGACILNWSGPQRTDGKVINVLCVVPELQMARV